ncbi:hypothetical protein FACS189428_0430 [Clostridia bacterium]|nr:hypothetical protein FACS189428_0430 [Clostridia bacterium]
MENIERKVGFCNFATAFVDKEMTVRRIECATYPYEAQTGICNISGENVSFWWAYRYVEIGTYWQKFLFTPLDVDGLPHGIQRVFGYYCGYWDVVLERSFVHGKLIYEKRYYPKKEEHNFLPQDSRVARYVDGKSCLLSCYDWNKHEWYGDILEEERVLVDEDLIPVDEVEYASSYEKELLAHLTF